MRHRIKAGKVGSFTPVYPKSPRHPRQKYLLTVKGLALYNELFDQARAKQACLF